MGLSGRPVFFGHVGASEDFFEHLALLALFLDFAADLLFLALNSPDRGQVGLLRLVGRHNARHVLYSGGAMGVFGDVWTSS